MGLRCCSLPTGSAFPGTLTSRRQKCNGRAGEVLLAWPQSVRSGLQGGKRAPPESCVWEHQEGQQPAQQSHREQADCVTQSHSDTVTQDWVTASDNARALPTHHVLSRLFGSDFVFSHSGRTDGVMVPASAEGPRHCHCHCPHCCLAWPSTTQPRTLASPRLTTSSASVSYPFCCYLFSSTSCSVWVLVLFPVSFSCHWRKKKQTHIAKDRKQKA